MVKKKYFPVQLCRIAEHKAVLSLKEISVHCQVHPDLVDRFVRLGLIDPVGREVHSEEWLFPREAVSMIQKILRLHHELGINYTGIGVVLELLYRIENLEKRIRELEAL